MNIRIFVIKNVKCLPKLIWKKKISRKTIEMHEQQKNFVQILFCFKLKWKIRFHSVHDTCFRHIFQNCPIVFFHVQLWVWRNLLKNNILQRVNKTVMHFQWIVFFLTFDLHLTVFKRSPLISFCFKSLTLNTESNSNSTKFLSTRKLFWDDGLLL